MKATLIALGAIAVCIILGIVIDDAIGYDASHKFPSWVSSTHDLVEKLKGFTYAVVGYFALSKK